MDQFIGDWDICSWTHDERIVFEGIPDDGFLVDSQLSITQPDPFGDFSLHWWNRLDQPCSVSGLHRLELSDPPKLIGTALPVSFAGRDVTCDLSLTLTFNQERTMKTLTFTISHSEAFGGTPDTGSGTITATAHVEPPILQGSGTDAARER